MTNFREEIQEIEWEKYKLDKKYEQLWITLNEQAEKVLRDKNLIEILDNAYFIAYKDKLARFEIKDRNDIVKFYCDINIDTDEINILEKKNID